MKELVYSPQFLSYLAIYSGSAEDEQPLLKFSFPQDSSPVTKLKKTEIQQKFTEQALWFAALKSALETCKTIYGLIGINGDREIIGTQQIGDSVFVTTMGHDADELLTLRKKDIQEALDFATRFHGYAEKLMLELGMPKLLKLDSLEQKVATAVHTEKFETTKDILLKCAEVIKASETVYRSFIKFRQDSSGKLLSKDPHLNEFIYLLQNSWNAECQIYGLGRNIIEDIERA